VRVEIKRVRVNRRLRGLVVELETNRGSPSETAVELHRRTDRVAEAGVARLSTRLVRVVLRVQRPAPSPGWDEVVVGHRHRVVARLDQSPVGPERVHTRRSGRRSKSVFCRSFCPRRFL
jgi:hypothetical protein